MSKCPHLWVLAADKYFDLGWLLAMLKWDNAPLFPARCHFCDVYRDFSKEEWEEHLKERMKDELQWRPISEAPKDGTRIWLYHPKCRITQDGVNFKWESEKVRIGKWLTTHEGNPVKSYLANKHGGFWSHKDSTKGWKFFKTMPTHFMLLLDKPLPPSP